MTQLALGALLGGLLACGCSSANVGFDAVTLEVRDSGAVDAGHCDVLTTSGCAVTEKCTWISDTRTAGHVGCAPLAATPVAVGGACTAAAPGPDGDDDCVAGAYCESGTCKAVCGARGAAPACDATTSCRIYPGLFGPAGAEAAGVCTPN